MDLADAHIKSIDYLKNNTNIKFDIFNIGTGNGYSVLEIVNAFSKINNTIIPYEFYPNRNGDIEKVFCNTDKSGLLLKWKATRTLEDMCRDSYKYILHKHIQ